MSLGYRGPWIERVYRRWFETTIKRKRRLSREHREYCERRKDYGPVGSVTKRIETPEISTTPYLQTSADPCFTHSFTGVGAAGWTKAH